jgi:hypothetical protein
MMKGGRRTYTVFLSYSSRDAWLTHVIAQKFRSAGIGVWIDEMSLTGGDAVIDAIIQGIRRADEAIVLVSNESIASQWVAVEIGIALASGKRITPLLNNVDDAMAPLKGLKSYELNEFATVLREVRARRRFR